MGRHRKRPRRVGQSLRDESVPVPLHRLANAVKSSTSAWAAVANAHTALATLCGMRASTRLFATPVANAHAALAKVGGMKAPLCHYTALANAVKSSTSAWASVANAHTALATLRDESVHAPLQRPRQRCEKQRVCMGRRRKCPRHVGHTLRDASVHARLRRPRQCHESSTSA